MASQRLSKEQASRIVNNMRVNVPLDIDYLYDVYEMASDAIEDLNKTNAQIEVNSIIQLTT